MGKRSIGVSEARRRLPQLVRTIAEEGGRVDVTLRGEPRVTIIRTADLTGARRRGVGRAQADVLRVEFAVPPASLVDVVRALRARIGRPRAAETSRSGRAPRGRPRR